MACRAGCKCAKCSGAVPVIPVINSTATVTTIRPVSPGGVNSIHPTTGPFNAKPGPRGPRGPAGPTGPMGPQGPPGEDADAGAAWVDSEILTGTIDGSNVIFTTALNYESGSTHLFLNGLRQAKGLSADYTESGANEITMTSPPEPGDVLLIDYRI